MLGSRLASTGGEPQAGGMSLKHAVLAVLSEAPGHGYEVHARLVKFLPLPRPCDRSRVYAVLVGLEQDGWIFSRKETAAAGRVRRRYWLSNRGQCCLREWLLEPKPGVELLRRSLLLRIALMEALELSPLPVGSRRPWRLALARRLRRREELLGSSDQQDVLHELLRQRELAHLEVEIRALTGWVRD